MVFEIEIDAAPQGPTMNKINWHKKAVTPAFPSLLGHYPDYPDSVYLFGKTGANPIRSSAKQNAMPFPGKPTPGVEGYISVAEWPRFISDPF